MISLSKKGETGVFAFMQVVFVLGLLLSSFIFFGYVTLATISKSVSTHNLEQYILFSRPLYSRNGFFYKNEITHRVEFGVVDILKFENNILEKLFDPKSGSEFAFKITLKGATVDKDIFYDEWLYNIIEPIYSKSKKYYLIQESIPVTIRLSDGKEEQGTLTIKEAFKLEVS